MNKVKKIWDFQDQYTLKKADPRTFSFWVNSIFAKQQVLLIFVVWCNFSKAAIKQSD